MEQGRAVHTAGSRNHGIDLLRGISILLVVVHHVALRIPLRDTALADVLPRRLLSALSYNGYEAVFVFFVISGFLITRNALQRWGRLGDIDIASFYVRRATRILPLLLALIAVLSVLHALGVERYEIREHGQTLGATVASALGLYLNWYEGRTGWLPGSWDVLWSLSIEEVFYLGFPLACLLIRDARVFVAMLVVLALSLPLTHAALADNEIWQEKAYLPGMSAIATGVLVALWLDRRALPMRTIILCRTAGVAGLLAVSLAGDLLWASLLDGYMLVLTGSAALLVASLAQGSIEPTRGLGWLRSMGRLSYEIYLTHMFVVFTAVDAFKVLAVDVRNGYMSHVGVVLYLLGTRRGGLACVHAAGGAAASRCLGTSTRRCDGVGCAVDRVLNRGRLAMRRGTGDQRPGNVA